MEPKISAIAALGERTRAICEGQQLLWVIPDDHKRLKEITMGHTLIMGRKTYDSIGFPLKGRMNVIVTRNPHYMDSIHEKYRGSIRVAHSSEEAIQIAKTEEMKRSNDKPEIFIFGGGEIYSQTLKYVGRLYLTLVDSDIEGSAHFPEYEKEFTKVLGDESHEHDGLRYRWLDLER